jgi:hypothetical protein
MSDRFVEQAKAGMSAIERLVSGLPGIRSYRDKELRREADYRLRQMIADTLEGQRQKLFETQRKLLKDGGLALLAEVDAVITRLQTLTDRIKSASYGYAGLFDAVKIKEEQLNALHRFDVALATQAGKIQNEAEALAAAVNAKENIAAVIDQLNNAVQELTSLFDKRSQAIVAPDLLTDSTYAPTVDPGSLKDAVG